MKLLEIAMQDLSLMSPSEIRHLFTGPRLDYKKLTIDGVKFLDILRNAETKIEALQNKYETTETSGGADVVERDDSIWFYPFKEDFYFIGVTTWQFSNEEEEIEDDDDDYSHGYDELEYEETNKEVFDCKGNRVTSKIYPPRDYPTVSYRID